MTTNYSEVAGLLSGVIVFITFFYSTLFSDLRELLKTDDIEGNTAKIKERNKDILCFLFLKWIPLVIVPVFLCLIVLFKTVDMTGIKNMFSEFGIGICFVEIIILIIYAIISLGYMIYSIFSFRKNK